MLCKMQAHVFTNHGEHKNMGKLVFTGSHKAVTAIAKSIQVSDDFTLNIDVHALVYVGDKGIWIDANPRALDRAAQDLMELAQSIRSGE